jgi:hypothetical protein
MEALMWAAIGGAIVWFGKPWLITLWQKIFPPAAPPAA